MTYSVNTVHYKVSVIFHCRQRIRNVLWKQINVSEQEIFMQQIWQMYHWSANILFPRKSLLCRHAILH